VIEVNIQQIIAFAKRRGLDLFGARRADALFTNVRPIDVAKQDEVTFCRFDGEKGAELLRATKSTLIFVPSTLASSEPFASEMSGSNKLFAVCETPRLEMAYFLREFWKDEPEETEYISHRSGGVFHRQANVADTAQIMRGAIVGKSVSIGENTVVYPGAVIDNAVIGDSCSIGSNAVIGGTGFGFEKDPENNETIDFPHIGIVRIGNHVRIGACSCVDRASIGETIVSDSVKIDNLVHIGHNAKIGGGTKIVALSIIGGSAQIGENCWLAPAAAIRDWIELGNGSIVGMGAVVTKSVSEGATVVGNPAREIQTSKRKYL
jgi:UDP-3-O-[3-hydroxymyristoyl] glucosamine N-acyltransferase